MKVTWDQCQREFEWDGSLRDIYVSDASPRDWDEFIRALGSWNYRADFSLDGTSSTLPESAAQLFENRASSAPLLQIHLGSVTVCCHFFWDEQLEFDLDPREVNGEAAFSEILRFMRQLGHAVDKSVVLTPENMPEAPIITYTPKDERLEYTEWVN